MATSQFRPEDHGLPYQNGSFNVGAVGWTVLCGGISYAALDYFYAGIKPPKFKKTPANGNPMLDYLYRRQCTAHFYTWHKFANAWSISQLPILSIAGEQDSLKELDTHIANRPVILCLYGGPFKGHHVVAWSCDRTKKTIDIFDSNHPDKKPTLTRQKNGDWFHSESKYNWTGWFMDWGHYTNKNRLPPLAFRYCKRCHGLNTASLGEEGDCLNGAKHDNHPDFEYFLPWVEGEGKPGWKVCGKCQGLYRQTSGDAPFCPALGMHTPQQNNPNWKDLSVMTSGPGEAGWRRCSTCTSLFWVQNNIDFGKCADGSSPHTPVPGESYVVANQTR